MNKPIHVKLTRAEVPVAIQKHLAVVCEGCGGSVESEENSDKRGLDRDNSELCLCNECKEWGLAAGSDDDN